MKTCLQKSFLNFLKLNWVLVPVLLGVFHAHVANALTASSVHWVGSWSASPQPRVTPLVLKDQTLRQFVHLSIGGRSVRIHLSNVFGLSPVTITSGHVGLRRAGTILSKKSNRTLLFRDQGSVTLQPGEEVYSDPIDLKVPAESDLAVSLYFANQTSLKTFHSVATATSYLSRKGDSGGKTRLRGPASVHSWYLLAGVDVDPTIRVAGSIVTLGDSITDGVGSSLDANTRYPDAFARRLLVTRIGGVTYSVLNQGIGFNRILNDQDDRNQPSISALKRFERDVLAQPGVKAVIIFEGINDIGLEPESTSSETMTLRILSAYRKMIAVAHAHGVKVVMGTLTPIGGSGYDSPEHRETRNRINAWIRSQDEADGIVDFDRAIRDPHDFERLKREFDCGDKLHPGDIGYQAMADAISLSLF